MAKCIKKVDPTDKAHNTLRIKVDTRGYLEYNNKCKEKSKVSQLNVGSKNNGRPIIVEKQCRPKILI